MATKRSLSLCALKRALSGSSESAREISRTSEVAPAEPFEAGRSAHGVEHRPWQPDTMVRNKIAMKTLRMFGI